MGVFTIMFYILLALLIFGVALFFFLSFGATVIFTLKTIVQIVIELPYVIFLGGYIGWNNLPKDFRKRENPDDSFKDALHFYNDILHFRKPTFD